MAVKEILDKRVIDLDMNAKQRMRSSVIWQVFFMRLDM